MCACVSVETYKRGCDVCVDTETGLNYSADTHIQHVTCRTHSIPARPERVQRLLRFHLDAECSGCADRSELFCADQRRGNAA